MVRIFHAYFPIRTLLLALADALVIVIGLTAGAIFVYGAGHSAAFAYGDILPKIAVAGIVCMLCIHYFDLYSSEVVADSREVATRLSQVVGTCAIILAILYYVYPGLKLHHRILFTGMILVGTLLIACRKLFFLLNGVARLNQRVVLLAGDPLAVSLAEEFRCRPELGIQTLGYIGDASDVAPMHSSLRRLGDFDDLADLVEQKRIDRVIVTMNERRGRLPLEPLLDLKSRGIRVEDGAEVYESVTGRIRLDSLRLSQLVFSDGFRVSDIKLLYKRGISIALSLVSLLLMLPYMLVIAIAIRLDSPGPALFRQKRIGKNGKVFTLYKFRSMRVDADQDGFPRPVEKDDQRLTRVGRWLRRSRMDELPQLYNILRGDMYFIGPRPFVVEQERELARQIPYYRYRWTVKPGATGWAQMHRGYCSTLDDNTEKLAYDLYYIKNVSVGLDLLILFETVKILLLGRGSR
ncbi:MAG TPA: TIGR03013 family XrtA/PEP-CTERM system glycosyltransferase [Candidatus Dormibacteraeota bacterium]|nr:TIGR03013 family XrtA/PEP-CTERM system glycosyltransferase [Candidatus Dormibacteraeota bacterium]